VRGKAWGESLSKVEASCHRIELLGGVALPVEGNVKTPGDLATYRMMELCYPHLKGDGCVVNLRSTAARLPARIRANPILPYAKSPAIEDWAKTNPEEAAATAAGVPLRSIGEFEQGIGEFVAMLCSDACSYVSGQSIALDGDLAYMP
jgi:meso-butanediol dehydrogenase/(S,S)-butanediol dehydrogenase/diacetyl reductase